MSIRHEGRKHGGVGVGLLPAMSLSCDGNGEDGVSRKRFLAQRRSAYP
jgi:hypothetical protein